MRSVALDAELLIAFMCGRRCCYYCIVTLFVSYRYRRQLASINEGYQQSPNLIDILYDSEAEIMSAESPPRQYFSLRWNNYQNNMSSVFYQLLHNQSFVDVTLACEESTFRAHKVSRTSIAPFSS